MSEILVTARIAIPRERRAAFIALAERCMRVARELDDGTLQYDWFIDAEDGECVVRERYRDSAAVLEHIAHLGEATRKELGELGMTLEICGDASPALIAAAAGDGVRFYRLYQRL